MRLFHIALVTLVAFAVTLTGCGGGDSVSTDPNAPIVLGHFAAMTGRTATFGTSTDEGIRLALDEINAAGGVLGRQLTVVTEDTQSSPQGAVTAVQKLLNRDRVQALLGEVASTNSLAAAPLADAARIPMLSPASTNPRVTQTGPYIFRSCFIDPFQGGAMANYAVKELGMKRVAILFDVKQDYSTGLRDFFRKTAEEAGARVVAIESFSSGDTEFKAQLTKIAATNPQAIYVPGYYTEIGLIVSQARELGISVPLMGGDGWDSERTWERAKDAANGCYFTNHYSPEETRPEVLKFIAAYKAKYNGKVPDAMAILGYDAMKLMADAIKRAGSTDPAKIRDALAATRDFPGASGNITINAERNAEKPIVINVVKNGRPTFVARIAPDGSKL